MQKIFIAFFMSLLAVAGTAQDTTQQVVPGRKNNAAQQSKPYLILISADGFRYDYADKYNASNLIRLRKTGVQAKSMKPSFPSVTFPNHYTIATGLYPAHHGLVYNQFFDRNKNASYTMGSSKIVADPYWYGGIPFWVLAEQQGMLSASYYFVGTEAPVKGLLPAYWYKYNSKTPINQRIDAVVNWLSMPEEIRPHLITFYLPETDDAGHHFGPESAQTKRAVLFVDSAINELTKKVSELNLPVNYIFLSDHGMAAVDTATRIVVTKLIDTARFIIRGAGTSLHLYAKDSSDILRTYTQLKKAEKDFTVYLRNNIPARWHYAAADDRYNRIGDIFVVPVFPKVLSSGTRRIDPGAHGFDPAIKDMHASFYAWGPQIKKGKTIATFENVDVYPFVCALLGLNITEPIDGKSTLLKSCLVK